MIDIAGRLFVRRTPQFSPASPADARGFAALHAGAFHRPWSDGEFEKLLRDPNVVADRCRLDKSVIGFVLSRIAADEAEILSIAVARSRQSKGLGRQLLDINLRRLAGLGVRRVFLEVAEDNVPALRLYRRAGFREVARRQGYYSHPADSTALVLRRDLASPAAR